MNKGIVCIAAVWIIHLLSFFLISNNYPELDLLFVSKELGYSATILFLGTLIMFVKFKPGQFVNRFMLVTVFQMLAILSFILALVYLKVKPLQTHGILFILTYLSGMAAQTIFFLAFSKKTS